MRLACMLALGAGVVAGVGCGSSGTIPSGDAEALRQGLDQVRAEINAGRCDAARDHVDSLRSDVRALDVPTRLRRNLEEGLTKLRDATSSDCQTATPQTTETQTIPSETTTTETDTTATATTPTTTQPTTTTPTTTTPTVPTATTEPPTGGVEPSDDDGELEP